MGRILSPRHTLPPNTTCTYYFHGFQPTDRVWIYFTNYHLQILQPATTTPNDGNAINNTHQSYYQVRNCRQSLSCSTLGKPKVQS